MITVTEYKDDKLGLILGFQDDESMLLNMQGRSYVVGEYDGAFTYILNGQPTERPASPVTRTDLTLFDVPNGATLWINGVSYAPKARSSWSFRYPAATACGWSVGRIRIGRGKWWYLW